MKTIKNQLNRMKICHFAIVIAFTAIFSSCSKEESLTTTEEDIDVSQVSEKIVNYVDDNYPDAYIYSAVSMTNCQAKTVVTLNTTEQLAFNSNHDFIGNGAQFRTGHHGPGHGGGHGHGNGNGHGHGFDHGHFDHIPVDSLPATITSYISTNFSGYQILHAERDSLCSAGAVIEVVVGTTGSAPVKLIFDASGNFLMSAERTDYSLTPAAVQSSVTANYPGYMARPRSVKFTLANGSIQYGVFLFNGTSHKRVILADDGTVICEQ